MRNRKLILASVVVIAPLGLVLRMKIVKGSEPPGRLIDNGDGTVTDVVTKLTWQQATGSSTYTTTTAAAYCAALNLGQFATGWRLPAVKELISIVDYESPTSPTIDTVAFPGTQVYWYFTSTAAAAGGNYLFSFNTGVMGNGTNGYYVRCVHSGLGGADGGP